MVAPAADRSIASTRACLVSRVGFSFAALVGVSVAQTGWLDKVVAAALVVRLVGCFDIGISVGLQRLKAATADAPPRP